MELDDDFDDVSEVLNALKALATPGPEADYSHLILPAAAEARLTPVARYAKERQPQARLVSRAALTVAALVVLVTMSSGMAFAANGAKPGDLLYGLDRALEAIGIGDGGADERLAETLALADSPTQIPVPGHSFETLTAPPTTAVEQETPTSAAPRAALLDQPGERPTGDEPVAGEETIDMGGDRSAPSVERGRATETPPENAPIPSETPAPKEESDDSTDQSPPSRRCQRRRRGERFERSAGNHRGSSRRAADRRACQR